MKLFNIKVCLDGTCMEESQTCPWYWRGSGVEDVEVPVYCYANVDVVAESEERARQIVLDYDFDDELVREWNPVKVISCNLVRDGEDDEEFIDVSYGKIYGLRD